MAQAPKNKGAGFELPDYYNLPPFFTIQKVAKTRNIQFALWTDLICRWLEANKKTVIYVNKDVKQVPFTNTGISRALKLNDLRKILDFMKEEGYGKWQDDEKTMFNCSWKKMQEWANIIYNWAKEEGMMNKILTLYDLHSGDDVRHTSFYKLENTLMVEILEVLADQGKAQVFRDGNVIDEFGVKFFAT